MSGYSKTQTERYPGWFTGLAIITVIAIVCPSNAQVLEPPNLNLAENKKITASSTCGEKEHAPEMYCRLTGVTNSAYDNLVIKTTPVEIQAGQLCEYCDSNVREQSHPAKYAVDGSEKWWQSPPLSRGIEYNEVNLTIDLGQEFLVSYVLIKMANSPRPGAWVLERSTDSGKTWSAWQYFAKTPSECWSLFNVQASNVPIRDNEAICTTKFSQVVPLEHGEIIVSLVDNRPSARDFSNSRILRDWTKATSVRMRLLQTKTLLGHLMQLQRQDPTVTRRYFYSIKDISIGGRCLCNGHAESCDKADPKDPDKLICDCQHNTCGAQCDTCCPGYVQKKWQPVKINERFECEACNCHRHSTECEYDPEVDLRSESLDINGRYSGGGVCKDCQHFTEGINCERCRAGYYHDASVPMTSIDACKPCRCQSRYSTGDCDRKTGQCLCKSKYTGRNCDKCNIGYYNYPRCIPCDCHQNGTRHGVCRTPSNGQCPCKPGFGGRYCRQCAQGHFNYPQCQRCRCNSVGSQNNQCDARTGQCYCQAAFAGSSCEQCAVGYYAFPSCNYFRRQYRRLALRVGRQNPNADRLIRIHRQKRASYYTCKPCAPRSPWPKLNLYMCKCDVAGCTKQICDNRSGRCFCKPNFTGPRCNQCQAGYYNYPYCHECRCSTYGSLSPDCRSNGQCVCRSNFAGLNCDRCAAGYYRFPSCIRCNCSSTGSIGQTCDQLNGQCKCNKNFAGLNCNRCKPNFYMLDYKCVECNCNPAGAVQVRGQPFGGCGVTGSQHCKCKDRVLGRHCDTCKAGFWNLDVQNPLGCIHCQCNLDGVIGGFDMCNEKTGQCLCKPAVTGRKCGQCSMGTYKFERRNPFGCRACDCNLGGSMSNDCEKISGKCQCKPRIEGDKCDTPEKEYYFPSLHQHKYEIEDGYQPGGGKAHFAFNEQQFPDFSWKGYAVMSVKQMKVILDINIKKPTLHRIVIRYMNKERKTIQGKVVITPKAQLEMIQTAPITFRPTSQPQFTKLTDFGSPFVMDPGQWMLSISTPPGLLLDYLVLIPQEYYEASILQHQIKRKCRVPHDNGPCLHYTYLRLPQLPTARFTDAYVTDFGQREKARGLENNTILRELDVPGMALIDDNSQPKIHFNVEVPIPGRYILLVNYFNPAKEDRFMKQVLHVKTTDDQHGSIELYNCPYSFLCRQVIKHGKAVLAIYDIAARIFTVTFEADQIHAYIESVIAVPYDEWNIGLIQPSLVCIRVNGECKSTKHFTPGGSIMIEAERGQPDKGSTDLPPGVKDPNMKLVKLDRSHPTLDLRGTIRSTGRNVLIAQYHQPNHPGFPVSIKVQTDDYMHADAPASDSGSSIPSESPDTTGILMAKLCTNPDGCRGVVHFGPKGVPEINLRDHNIHIKINSSSPHDLWLDNVLLVPSNQYNPENLGLDPHDLSGKFLKNCVDESLVHRESPECRDLLSALSSDYNNGALPCDCNRQGSLTNICDIHGGQCRCRSDIIGRDCSACKAGYFGFPNCQRCNCKVGLCHPETGKCICPPRVTGRNCDQCLPNTYGYDPYVGCEECGCERSNVRGGDLNCNQNTGKCNCRFSFGGRTCDECAAGYHSYPQCTRCSCNGQGAEDQVCNPDNGQCLCKKNVLRPDCRSCKRGTFHLEKKNPNGCTTCSCFGITTRCDKSDLRWDEVTTVKNWNIHNTVGVSIYSSTFIEAKVGPNRIKNEGEAIYWSAPSAYLGNKITSYGGILRYSILFTSDSDGIETGGPDVILVGDNISLAYRSTVTPENNQMHEFNVDLREYMFVNEVLGTPVKRDQFMMVLAHLEGIYLKGSYLSKVQEIRLSNIRMDIATKDGTGAPAYTVEKCDCPSSYRGTSCEKCAPGHYRRRKEPLLGTCSPCECNGHTKQCDPRTGECLNCGDNTMGHYCHKCKPGYHGNPALGGCKICECPLSIPSNNFAAICHATESGRVRVCECKKGYSGLRCNTCSPGYYGDPMKIGSSCKKCQCSGNLDLRLRNSCDLKTGKCLNCTHNSTGENCELCKPWWYGDAIVKKNCKPCQCNKCGSNKCDNKYGNCVCHPNVEGPQCERCEPYHYGFNECNGCKRCNCGLGSRSKRCDEMTGQCECLPGVGGRTCDKCLDGYWKYSSSGCQPCPCATQGVARTCDQMTGECRCKTGYEGYLCENCIAGWVRIEGEGCRQCDKCTNLLLSDLNKLNATLSKLYNQLRNMTVGIIAQEKLKDIRRAIDELQPKVDHLLRHGGGNFTLENQINRLNDQVDKLMSRVNQDEMKSNDIKREAKDLRDAAYKPRPSDIVKDINRTIDYLNALHIHGGTSEADVQSFLAKAHKILKAIEARNFDNQKDTCDAELETAKKALEMAKKVYQPAVDQEKRIQKMNEAIDDIRRRLNDLQDKSDDTQKHAKETWDILKTLNYDTVMHAGKDVQSNISALESMLKMARDHLNDTKYNEAGIKNLTQQLDEKLSQLDAAMKKLYNTFTNDLANKLAIVKPIVMKAIAHPESLLKTLKELEDVYNKNTSQRFVDAANAYKNIVNAINDAMAAAKKALADSKKAHDKSQGIGRKAGDAKLLSLKKLMEATLAYNTTQTNLQNMRNSANNVTTHVRQLNQELQKKLDEIKNTYENYKREQSRMNLRYRARQTAEKADNIIEKNDNINKRVDHILNNLPEVQRLHNQTVRNIHDINQNVMNSFKQLNTAKALLPNITSLVRDLYKRIETPIAKMTNVSVDVEGLRKMIETARSQANEIVVGLRLFRNTTLRLRNPIEQYMSASYNKITLYIRTNHSNGLLAYVGSPLKKKQDYLSLELDGGQVVLKYDLGSGPAVIMNPVKVDNDKWYSIEARRIGTSGTLLVKGNGMSQNVTGMSKGIYSVLEVNPEQTYIYVGGFPNSMDAQMPQGVTRNRYDGAMEFLSFNDYHLGFWNFIKGMNNYAGYKSSRSSEEGILDGYRFTGRSFADLNVDFALFQNKFEMSLDINTFKPDGLLVLMFDEKTADFASLDIRQGYLVFQFDLGGGRAFIKSDFTVNDGQWHNVIIKREKRNGLMAVNKKIFRGQSKGAMTRLSISKLYIGGYVNPVRLPRTNLTQSNVSDYGFNGCIKKLQINSDLNGFKKSNLLFKMNPGCPPQIARAAKFISTISSNNNYLFGTYLASASSFLVTLKFKSDLNSKDGILLYVNLENDPNKMFAIYLENGYIFVASKPKNRLKKFSSKLNNYADGNWHYISVLRNNKGMQLIINDKDEQSLSVASEPLGKINLYFGGIPTNVGTPKAVSKNNFHGCIEDVTINGMFFNFVTLKATGKVQLNQCRHEIKKVTSKPSRPTLPPIVPVDRCGLPLTPRSPSSPVKQGLRFGSSQDNSRWDIEVSLKDKSRNSFQFYFRTLSANAVLLYAADKTHNDFISVYLENGQLVYAFNCGSGKNSLKSNLKYNDGNWHKVDVSREQIAGKLSVDDNFNGRFNSVGKSTELNIIQPVSIGGVSDSATSNAQFAKNVPIPYYKFVGCIRDLKVLNNDVNDDEGTKFNVNPCYSHEENGTFIGRGGGSIIVADNFTVGADMVLSLQIKPRTINGVLASVYADNGNFFLLQLVDGVVYATFDNGRGPFTVKSKPKLKYHICDGQWHKIEVKKYKQMSTLFVDGNKYGPSYTIAGASFTKTSDPFYIGGLPAGTNHKHVMSNEPYVGCIKNLVDYSYGRVARPLSLYGKSTGNVHFGSCSTM